MNKTVVSGVVVKIASRDGQAGHMTISCPIRLGKRTKEQVVINYPIVEFNSRTVPEAIPSHFKTGDRVYVEGHLQSYLRRLDDGSTNELLFLYADSIKPEASKFEKVFGIPGRIYDSQVNDVYLKGTVTSISLFKGTDGYNLKIVPDGETKNEIKVVYFRGKEDFAKNISVGSKVAVVAMMQSLDSGESKGRTSGEYQNVVASDIMKVEG